ncbi:hypothetical protein QUV80_11750 [Paraclostridium benzoelyticum]|nr:hypothetical protein [Paraclostridium benzoelyticum]
MNNLVLKKVAKSLNDFNCMWAIGGSTLLNHYGLVEEPKDIDILVNPKDTENVKLAMNKIGKPLETINNSDKFKSDDFKNRTHLISKYFECNGVSHNNILISNLNLQMPEYITNEILNLISY